MAQTGFTPIQLYSTNTAAAEPTAGNLINSTLGSELAINITDGKLFYKDNANVVQVIGWKTVPTSAGGTGLTSYTAGDLIYYASGTTFTKLAIGATGRFLSSTGSAPQWSAPAALTETDDTNVTMTLGGSPSTALLSAVSMTLGWTGTLAVGRGGTGLSTLTTGYIPFGNATSAFGSDAGLYWDNTNKRLAVGSTTTPLTTIEGYATANSLQIISSVRNNQAGSGVAAIGFNVASSAAGDTSACKAGIGLVRQNAQGVGSLCFYNRATTDTASFTTADEDMRIHASSGVSIGNTTDPGAGALRVQNDVISAAGNFVVGTSGKGIDFSATPGTGTSELLNDYEEGTWTPVLGGVSGTSGQTYSTQAGYYIKTGRSVQCTFRIVLSAKGTITGNAQLQGLPFTSKNANGAQSKMSIATWTTATGYYQVFGVLGINATAADLYGITGAQTNSLTVPIVTADINNTTQLIGCVFYYTDS